MKTPLDLSTCAYGATRGALYDFVILPWGATEPHNLHLPYMTDCILAQAIALDAAHQAQALHGINCMVLPPVSFGSQNPGQRELRFCIHARYETQKAILTDIVASLHTQGFSKLLIVNGHGGNCFKNMIRDLAVDYPDFMIASSEWYTVCSPKEFFDEPGDHADEVETSVMMHYHPELVDLSVAGAGASRPFAARTLNEHVAWIPRHWQRVTDDTGIGNPALATAEKGRRFVGAITKRYVELLHELTHGKIYMD